VVVVARGPGAGTMIGAWETLLARDVEWFLALNRALHSESPPWHHDLWLCANALGNPFLLALPIGAILVLSNRVRPALDRLAVLGASQALAAVAVHVLKRAVRRPRPQAALAEAFERGEAFGAFGEQATRWSLPSGHAACAVALVTVFVVVAFRHLGVARGSASLVLGLVLCAFALLARVYAGMHYPLDLAAGGLVGVLSVALVLALRRLVLTRWARVHPRPAPGDAR
jgi:undecaprenyl-diphosphatase